jgi:CubicO group peptidase (beta-lactamase class C family)
MKTRRDQSILHTPAIHFAMLFCLMLMSFLYSRAANGVTLDEIVNSISDSSLLSIDVAVTSSAGVCFATKNLNEVVNRIPRFHVASISKLLTAVRILQLRDKGLLELDDKVSEHHVLFSDADYEIQHLLTHTSGLRDRANASDRISDEDVENYLNSLNRQRRRTDPGERWRYADAGFNVLGAVIAQVTGVGYTQSMQEAVLAQLDMNNSSFLLTDVPSTDRMVSYNRRGRASDHPWDLAFAPSAGLQSTAADLLKFAQTILDVSNGNQQEWLATSTLQEMVIPRLNTEYDGVAQGLGWQLADSPAGTMWRHAGGEDGFESLLTIYPESNIAIVVLGNQDDWPRFELEREILNSALEGTLDCE